MIRHIGDVPVDPALRPARTDLEAIARYRAEGADRAARTARINALAAGPAAAPAPTKSVTPRPRTVDIRMAALTRSLGRVLLACPSSAPARPVVARLRAAAKAGSKAYQAALSGLTPADTAALSELIRQVR